MIYYDQDSIVIRDSVMSDVDFLKDKLRDSDVEEVLASHGHTPEEALKGSIESLISMTVTNKGIPTAMFGINPVNLIGEDAVIWLLGSIKLRAIEKKFLRNNRRFISMFLSYYPRLWNYVDARNTESIRWLRWLGARIEEAKPYGVAQIPFHYFEFKRS